MCAKDAVCRRVVVPSRIVVAVVAELRVYGFWRREVVFAELFGILEKTAVGRGSGSLPNLRDEFGFARSLGEGRLPNLCGEFGWA